MFVDVHTHLYVDAFKEDRDRVIERAKKAGFVALVNSGTHRDENLLVLELARKHDVCKATLGLHPTDIVKMSREQVLEEVQFIKDHKREIIGVGEIGLDFYHVKDEVLREKQKEYFRLILRELQPLGLPFVIHSRKAERECLEILEEFKPEKVLFHCFTGRQSTAKQIERYGWYISVPPLIIRDLQFQGLVRTLSVNSLLTETDAPFLAPPPKGRNEPVFIKYTIGKIAELKNMTEEEVVKNIFLNYQRLFS